jgi:putative phage-type endonuclease
MSNASKFELFTPDNFNDAELLGVFESGSDEWHAARGDGIGGSDVPTLLGLNPWQSAYYLWAVKTGNITPEPVDNWSVKFGRAFELPILEMWAAEHPEYEVYLTGTYRSKSTPYLVANPDALARHRDSGEWLVVEVKTARYGWQETPPAYEAQVMHYMDILGISRAVIVAVAGWSWEERFLDYDEFTAGAQRASAARFWAHVCDNTKPDYDGAESTYKAVRAMSPEIDTDNEIEIDGGHSLVLAAQEFAAAQEKLNKIKSGVLDLMGDAKHAYIEHEGQKIRIASRQARRDGMPFLVVKGV